MFVSVEGRLATMRKPQNFTVQPLSDGRVMVQSDKRIGMFNPTTRAGVLSTRGNTFAHLHPIMGATRYDFPAEFVTACLAAMPTPGGTTDLGGVTVINTVQVIS